jgi:oxygen-independent coproporphyrinogen-3 oxidase
MPLGLYISVPFCRSKCTYCNFASDVFSAAVFENYLSRLCAEVQQSARTVLHMGCLPEGEVDSIYVGGGTPTVLDVTQLERVFVTIRQNFAVDPQAEITVECAPGTLSPSMLNMLVECGANRVSLGVQSFVDQEAASVGRLHRRNIVLEDISRLRAAGISNVNVDLIAGLPHQTPASWERSLSELISAGVPHASVYMLEVDQDSRLGRELIAGGQRYHAHFVPDEDLTADLYEFACDRLNLAGIEQYEISNFARQGFGSKHNFKYWTRQPYLGFGVDAHSMLVVCDSAVRFANPDSLAKYLACEPASEVRVDRQAALEESFFLGLRLNRGVEVRKLEQLFPDLFPDHAAVIDDLVRDGLLEGESDVIRLTRRGRLLSNEVFARFIGVKPRPAVV